jgi:hypothetical protein
VDDYLLALWVDRNTCRPYTGPGRVGHVVRVSDTPNMTIINEFTDGGKFEHSDCAPASLQSWLIDRAGVKTSIQEIEQIAGTNLNGTGWKGVEAAGAHWGLTITFSPNNPPSGWIMNPGGGFIEQPSAFPSYIAASQGGCLVLLDPAAKPPKPLPPPNPPKHKGAPDMAMIRTPDGSIYLLLAGGKFIPLGDGGDVAILQTAGIEITTTPVSVLLQNNLKKLPQQ